MLCWWIVWWFNRAARTLRGLIAWKLKWVCFLFSACSVCVQLNGVWSVQCCRWMMCLLVAVVSITGYFRSSCQGKHEGHVWVRHTPKADSPSSLPCGPKTYLRLSSVNVWCLQCSSWGFLKWKTPTTSCWICGGQSVIGTGCSWSTWGFRCHCLAASVPSCCS